MSQLTTRDIESRLHSEIEQCHEKKSKIVRKKKVYDIPYNLKINLRNILEDFHEQDKEFWKDLGRNMGLDATRIQVFPFYNFFFQFLIDLETAIS